MKKWVENKEPSGAVVHTLVFGHHGDDPKMMVEEMVYDHFADEKRYYEEICEELDMEN